MHQYGPHAAGGRPPKTFRGSRARVRRLTRRGNWFTELWILIVVVLFLMFVFLPWFAEQTSDIRPAPASASPAYRK
jgi:uncharacterized iron-regulated membrane protein